MKSARPILVGMGIFLSACASTQANTRDDLPALDGTWQGRIEAPGQARDVTLRFNGDRDGTLEVSGEAAGSVPVRLRTDPESSQVVVTSQNPPATLVGVRSGEEITGTYYRDNKNSRFRLKRTN